MNLFSALLRALAGRSKPKPKPVPQPAILRCGVSVRGVDGAGLANASGVLTLPSGVHIVGVNSGGRIAFETSARGPVTLTLSAPDYQVKHIDLAIVAELGDYQLAQAFPAVGKLDVAGKLFTMDGQPYSRKLGSIFLLGQRVARGEDLAPLAAWLRSVKLTGGRILCQWRNNADGPYILTIEQIVATCKWAAGQGFELKVCILADCQEKNGFNQSHEWQVERVRDVRAAIVGLPGITTQICNEPRFNGSDVNRIMDDLGLWKAEDVIDTGDYDIVLGGGGAGNPGFKHHKDVGNHGGRGPEHVVDAPKTGHFMYDGWAPDNHNQGNVGFHGQSVACGEDEPIAAGEASEPGRTDADPNNWEDMGAGWKIGVAYATFHERRLMLALVPEENATECARRMSDGMDFFPDGVFAGDYKHDGNVGHPLETAGDTASEVVAILHGNKAYVAAMQPTENYKPVPRDGWRIVKQGGWRGNYLWMER